MVIAPAEIPVTTPVNKPTVPIPIFELVHEPPILGLINVAVDATQTLLTPVIGEGVWLTVNNLSEVQPPGIV